MSNLYNNKLPIPHNNNIANAYIIVLNTGVIYIYDINARSNALFDQYPVIYFSYFNRNIDILNVLIYLRANLLVTEGIEERNALHFAAMKGDIEIVTLLLEANPDLVHIPDRDGVTPLMYAAIGGNPEVMQILINAGANPHDIDSEENNALNYAVEANDSPIINLLEPYELLFPHMDFLGS